MLRKRAADTSRFVKLCVLFAVHFVVVQSRDSTITSKQTGGEQYRGFSVDVEVAFTLRDGAGGWTGRDVSYLLLATHLEIFSNTICG